MTKGSLNDPSGVGTGWTGVDMSNLDFSEVDFLISLNPLKTVWEGGGGDFIHAKHLGVQLWLLRRRIDVIS